jgi:hypothetical protein
MEYLLRMLSANRQMAVRWPAASQLASISTGRMPSEALLTRPRLRMGPPPNCRVSTRARCNDCSTLTAPAEKDVGSLSTMPADGIYIAAFARTENSALPIPMAALDKINRSSRQRKAKVTDGRGRNPTADVPGDFATYRGTAAAAAVGTGMRRPISMHQRCPPSALVWVEEGAGERTGDTSREEHPSRDAAALLGGR